jgi:hypothetical protein
MNISKQCEYDLDQAIGGSYELLDGRKFWMDKVVVWEVLRRIRPIVQAELERKYLDGKRHPNTKSGIGGV